jgi:hypothetical protein
MTIVMDQLYYVGFYVLDEHERDWVSELKDPPPSIFKSFFNTKKISYDKYVILEIIILDKFFIPDIRTGDIIKNGFGMLNYTIYRGEQEISNNGFENVYIIKNEDFKCFYDWSVDNLIDKLYNKLNNYERVIGVNPYSKIFESLKEYNKKE